MGKSSEMQGQAQAGKMGRDGERSASLCKLSLARFPSSFGKCKRCPALVPQNVYSVFKSEPIHNLYHGISGLLKSCFLSFVESSKICAKESGSVRGDKAIVSLKGSTL